MTEQSPLEVVPNRHGMLVRMNGFTLYAVVRRPTGWWVISNTSARTNSRSGKLTAKAAAASYLKGKTLARIKELGQQHDIERCDLRFDDIGRDEGSFAFYPKPNKPGVLVGVQADRVVLGVEAVMSWCREQFGPQGKRWRREGFRMFFTDMTDATAFKIRWC